ncbi:DUF1877 family protein [Streptomyces sp. NPDC059582]|uniref:DUF1877 family protein n=1 Tax=Streptomyces sp. NPDC059582 TaxID=3346875 RepID=UPI0036A3BAB5
MRTGATGLPGTCGLSGSGSRRKVCGATSYDQLVSGVDPAELTSTEVYPLGWSEPDALEWGRHWYEGLTQLLEAAAGADDAVLVWLDR